MTTLAWFNHDFLLHGLNLQIICIVSNRLCIQDQWLHPLLTPLLVLLVVPEIILLFEPLLVLLVAVVPILLFVLLLVLLVAQVPIQLFAKLFISLLVALRSLLYTPICLVRAL